MAWRAKGDDRARSYKLYQDLHKAYQEQKKLLESTQAELVRKDELIRALAAEISSAVHGPTTERQPPTSESGVVESTPAPPRRTDRLRPLSEIMAEVDADIARNREPKKE